MATEGSDRVLRVETPLSSDVIRSLRLGDEVWLDGVVWGVRDATLIRMFDEGDHPADVDFKGAVFLHTAPSVRRDEEGRYVPVSVGTTTSMRMDRFTEGCMRLGVGAIVGKGGLSAESARHLHEHGGVYLAITGGAASPETLQVKEIETVHFEDLMPECLWQFRVEAFGPLFVAMDSTGGSLYQEVASRARANLQSAYRVLGVSG